MRQKYLEVLKESDGFTPQEARRIAAESNIKDNKGTVQDHAEFFRLSPGTEIRLRYAYFITCREVVKGASGNVSELRCTYDPATRGGNAPDGRKVKATIHWVSAADSVPAEVRLYNPLFIKPEPDVANFANDLNPNSLEVISDARVEPALTAGNSSEPVQFERLGYFARDRGFGPRPVFNRTVGLRDSYAKVVDK